MINRQLLFNKGILKKSAMSVQHENTVIQARLIALLKAHPEGMECDEAAQACGVSSEKLMHIITLNYHDIPIGYDRSYDSKLYWVGI